MNRGSWRHLVSSQGDNVQKSNTIHQKNHDKTPGDFRKTFAKYYLGWCDERKVFLPGLHVFHCASAGISVRQGLQALGCWSYPSFVQRGPNWAELHIRSIMKINLIAANRTPSTSINYDTQAFLKGRTRQEARLPGWNFGNEFLVEFCCMLFIWQTYVLKPMLHEDAWSIAVCCLVIDRLCPIHH